VPAMKNYRYLLYYILTIGGFTLLMYMVVLKGELLNPVSERPATVLSQVTSLDHFRESVNQNISKALPRLLLQIITIIAIARIFGYLSRKIGQPAVIGEIIAGISLVHRYSDSSLPEFQVSCFHLSLFRYWNSSARSD
jgi:hypothetical protein